MQNVLSCGADGCLFVIPPGTMEEEGGAGPPAFKRSSCVSYTNARWVDSTSFITVRVGEGGGWVDSMSLITVACGGGGGLGGQHELHHNACGGGGGGWVDIITERVGMGRKEGWGREEGELYVHTLPMPLPPPPSPSPRRRVCTRFPLSLMMPDGA